MLYDDRNKKIATPGEKFNDADLIGIPIRLTVSRRTIKTNGVELKLRGSAEAEVVDLEGIVEKVVACVAECNSSV